MKEGYITYYFCHSFYLLNGTQGFVIAIPSFRLKFLLDPKYQVKDMITFSSKSVSDKELKAILGISTSDLVKTKRSKMIQIERSLTTKYFTNNSHQHRIWIYIDDEMFVVRLFKRFVYLEISAITDKSVSKVSHSILHSCETIRYPPGRHFSSIR